MREKDTREIYKVQYAYIYFSINKTHWQLKTVKQFKHKVPKLSWIYRHNKKRTWFGFLEKYVAALPYIATKVPGMGVSVCVHIRMGERERCKPKK